MFYYIGLADDPQKKKEEIGNPLDWGTIKLESEGAANSWKAKYLTKTGYV